MAKEYKLPNPATSKENVEKIVGKFAAGPGETEWDAPVDVHDVGNLESKELTEELLSEYHAVSEKLKSMEDIKEMLRQNILKVMGREENAIRGKFAVFCKTSEREGGVDYKRLLKDKEITDEILASYRKPATTYQKLEVKKLG